MRLLATAALPLALAASLGLMAPGAMAAKKDKEAAADPKDAYKVQASPKFFKIAKEVQDLISAKDFAGATAKLPEAEAAATTPDDHYFIGSFHLNIGLGTSDQALQRKGLEEMLGSGKVAPDSAPRYELEVGKMAQIAKDWASARDHYLKATADPKLGGDPYVLLAETYFSDVYDHIDGNHFDAQGKATAMQGLPYLKKAIEAQQAVGKAVPPEWYVRGMKISILAEAPDAFEWSKETIEKAPTGENWRVVLRTLQDNNKTMTRDENLDVLRLMAATNALQGDYSYSEYAEAAWRAGLPGEVVTVVDKGNANGEIKEKARYDDIYKLAVPAVAKDKPTLASSEAAAQKAPTGKPAASTASAYMSYGDYAKAAELYRLALQKGGVDTNEVNTRLGMALAQSGDMAGAHSAFEAVSGSGVRKQLAELWTIWLDNKSQNS